MWSLLVAASCSYLPLSVSSLPRPATRASAIMATSEPSGLDMQALASRIKAVKEAPEPERARLFVLDSMVPGQVLEMDVPEAFADALDQCEAEGVPPIMVGRARLTLLSHAVECRVEQLRRRSDHSAAVTLVGGRYCEIVDAGEDEGSRWLGRAGRVSWCAGLLTG